MSDSEQGRSRTVWLDAAVLAAAALVIGFLGIGWGLPSMDRNAIYFSVGQDLPSVPREIVENSWKHFPEFGWLEKNERPDNLQGKIKRSLFNPVRSYHPDEYVIFKTLANMNPGERDLDPKFYAWPSFFIYLVAAALKLCSLVGLVHLSTDIRHYFEHPGDMARMYVVGRALVVCFGAGTVALMYLVGARLRSRRCGWVAALALLASPAFVINIHYMTADLPMLFLAVLTVLFCLSIVKEPSLRTYLAAGAAAGLCAGMKFIGGVILFTLLYAHVIAWLQRRGTKHRWLLFSLALAAACFCVVNPFHVLHAGKVLEIMALESEFVTQAQTQVSWLAVPFVGLQCGLGWLDPMIGLAGFFRFSLSKRLPDILVASAFVVYLVMARISSPFLRHYLILVPFVILLASLLVVDVTDRLTSPRRRKAALAMGAALLIGSGLWTSVRAQEYFLLRNVRTEGGRWIADHIEKGEKIAVISEPWQFDCPPLDLQRYNVVVTGYDVERTRAERPTWLVGTSLQFQSLYGFEPPTGDMKRFQNEILGNEAVASRLSFPLSRMGFCRRCPQDMRYVWPDVLVYRLQWPETK